MEARPTLFLDRDGILVRDTGYITDPDKLEYIEETFEAIRAACDKGALVIVITNQSAVGRGWATLDQVEQVNGQIAKYALEKGGKIDDFFVCPHHPDDECDCRKPLPGLFFQGFNRFPVDRERSLMIGDSERDITAAKAAGIKGILADSPEAISNAIRNYLDTIP